MGLTRRDALLVGSGLALGAAGVTWATRRGPRAARPAGSGGGPASIRPSAARYGHGVSPPASLGPGSLDAVTRPPAPSPSRRPITREAELDVVEQTVPVAEGHVIQAWTFGGGIPGPILRATEGDRLVVRLHNRSRVAHNLHFHGRHEVEADGWEPVAPGAELTYRLTAAPFGVHPYHCDMTPDADHLGSGLYGVLIVDPPGGRPPAHEFVLALGGFDTDGDERSDLCGWNGAAGFFAKYPIKVPAGELVRLYVVNLLGDEPLVSFHLHAQTFDVYRTGTRLEPDERTDVVTLGPTERAILEFRLPGRGRYMFHPHQRRLAERGAMGWLAAI